MKSNKGLLAACLVAFGAWASFAEDTQVAVYGLTDKTIVTNGCKITGAGVYKVGAKVSLRATAAKGSVFAGWYEDAAFSEEARMTDYGDWRNPSLTVPSLPVEGLALFARFLPLSSDFCGAISVADESGVPTGAVSVVSESLPTVTVTGLPAGLTFDKKACALVLDESKLADGNYAFVISAKNAGGYKNDRVVAFVTEGHGGEKDPLDWGEKYAVGTAYRVACDEFQAASAKDTLALTGLPSGFKLVKETADGLPVYHIEGTPTKAGRYTVTWKETHAQAKVEVQYYMTVEGVPSKYVGASEADLPAGCKVSGSAVYAPGAKATLKATAGKGYVFAGWYEDADFDTPVADCDDYRNPTLAIADVSAAASVYYPRFVALKDDYCRTIRVGYDGDVPCGKIEVDSVSLPTVTVAGLPAGLTFDKAACALVCDESKLKDGDYAFVVTAKNTGGYKNDLVVAFAYGAGGDIPPWVSEYAVGQIVREKCGLFEPVSEKDTFAMSGLPTGLALVKTADTDGMPVYRLEGVPTKAGRYAVKCTTTANYYDEDTRRWTKETTVETYYMTVQGAPSRYVEVVAVGPAGCKVTGSGVYAAGATVKTAASAADNWVFAGWYVAEEEGAVTNAYYNVYAALLGKDGDARPAAQTWLCGTYEDSETVPATLLGCFATKDDDAMYGDAISIFAADDESSIYGEDLAVTEETEGVYGAWNVRFPDDAGRAVFADCTMSIIVRVDSVSAPKLTVKGSISGITVVNYGTVALLYYEPTGKTAPKPGEYALTFTAVNQSKATVSRTLVVRVPNQYAIAEKGEDLLPNLDGSADGHYVMTVGETLAEDSVESFKPYVAPEGIVYGAITVSGLPSGVTCKDGVISGVPTKTGVYTMTVTVQYKYAGEAKFRKAEATAFFRVKALDVTTVGTFNGAAYDAEGNAAGTISATVSASGKVTSCKLVNLAGKSTAVSLKTQTFSDEGGYYVVEGTDAAGAAYHFELVPAAVVENELGGALYARKTVGGEAEWVADACQNVWGNAGYKAMGLLPNFPTRGIEVAYEEDALTLLFQSAGAVKAVRGAKSASSRFELTAYDKGAGWMGVLTVNVPDGTEDGYCKTFAVEVTEDLEIALTEQQ